MNYILEIRAFYDSLEINSLSAQAINLWHALMHIANKAQWKDSFSVAIATLELKTGLKKKAIINARNLLAQKGYISYSKGTGSGSATYTINSCINNGFVCHTETQTGTQSGTQTGTQSGTQTGTQSGTINKINKNKLNTHSNECVTHTLAKKQYGEYGHVLLTDDEFQKLHKEHSNADEAIAFFDKYIECKGDKDKNHCVAIERWVFDALQERKENTPRVSSGSFDTDDFFNAAVARSYEYD